jgi:CubicO group peptidase (beta-lactamase class C family)
MKTYALILIVLLTCIACGQKSNPNHEQEVDALVAPVIEPGAGVTIAVAEGEKILFSKGYGLANPEYDIPNTPGTIFHVASVSKQFTAFAMTLLADQGKISLDDDIRKHLPELHDFGHKITIKQLIHHTSGLRDQWNLLALAGWRLDDVITHDQVLRLISHQKELNFKPGDEFSYCNTGYTLMAEILHRVTGKSFPEWCEENIFSPLNMDNTLFYVDHEMIVKNRAYSYHKSSKGLKKSILSYANAGATSLFTTAEDLTKWSNNFYSMKVGNANVMRQMEERGILNKGDTVSYAFGQGIGDYKGIRLISHDGADAGYRSSLMRFPEQKYTIVVLSNLGSVNAGRLAMNIADIFLKDHLKPEDEKAQDKKQVAGNVKVSGDVLKKYEGKYQLDDAMVLTFSATDGKLMVEPSGQPKIELQAKSDTEFVIEQYGVKIVFDNTNRDTVTQLTFTQGGQKMVAPRAKPFDIGSIDLSKYTGTYFSPELQTSYTLVVKNDTLVANHIRHNPAKMRPVGKEAFTSDVWYMSKFDFIRDEEERITGFKVSSGRVKNVVFNKQ